MLRIEARFPSPAFGLVVALLVALTTPAPHARLAAQSLPDDVQGEKKISALKGGFTGTLTNGSLFGGALAWLGDVDGDGLGDALVGAAGNDRVWLLFLHGDGTVKSQHAIGSGQGGFTGGTLTATSFGAAVAALGDLDGDGVGDVAVGAPRAGIPTGTGAVWILLLKNDGTVKANVKLGVGAGGFLGPLVAGGYFGAALAGAGDLDGDGIGDLFVGHPRDGDSGPARGAVWILFLNADGTVKGQSKLSALQGGFTGALDDGDHFGSSLAGLGDLDGDGLPDLAVGADSDDEGGSARGAIWILFLDASAGVKAHVKLASGLGGFTGVLDDGDAFGVGLARLPDLDGNGFPELAAGAIGDDDGPFFDNCGAVWILSLLPDGTCQAHQKISVTQGGFAGGGLGAGDQFGVALAPANVPASGVCRGLLVGAQGDDDGDNGAGAFYVLFLTAGQWSDLGGSLEGHGTPTLTHEGTLCPGNPLTLSLQSGQSASVAVWLFIGFSPLNAPFMGGTLVPSPDLFYFTATDGQGNLTLSGPWPAGVPQGFKTIFQFWTHDSFGPQGLAATAALRASAP